MAMKFEGHDEFFACMGDDMLHPTSRGECMYPVTIEQMYQFFKQRYDAELLARIDGDKPGAQEGA